MRISVRAKPGAHGSGVERIDDSNFVVSVKEPPVRGLANAAIVRLLAEYFHVPSTHVKIISGHTSRNKIIEIQ